MASKEGWLKKRVLPLSSCPHRIFICSDVNVALDRLQLWTLGVRVGASHLSSRTLIAKAEGFVRTSGWFSSEELREANALFTRQSTRCTQARLGNHCDHHASKRAHTHLSLAAAIHQRLSRAHPTRLFQIDKPKFGGVTLHA